MKREMFSPYATTMRARQRYTDAERKAGPMVRQMRYLGSVSTIGHYDPNCTGKDMLTLGRDLA